VAAKRLMSWTRLSLQRSAPPLSAMRAPAISLNRREIEVRPSVSAMRSTRLPCRERWALEPVRL
jgi:hypothetical protein